MGRVESSGTSKPRIIRYELPGAWELFAGATDADNDHLSTTVAAPQDWWFHADNVAGSHVVLRAKADEDPTMKTLRQAAAVAAYHSKARGAAMVRVYCTRGRYVKKRRGMKTGTVEVSHGKILRVCPEIGLAKRVHNERR